MAYQFVPLFFLIHILLFVLFYYVSGKFLESKAWFLSLGEKLFKAKEKQLGNNALLKAFARAVENESIYKARFIIFSLVLLKSIGMALLGFVGMSFIMVPIQAIMMAALMQKTSQAGVPEADLFSVTGIQLAAMTTATVLGNFMGWRHFVDRLWFNTIFDRDFYLILIASLVLITLSWFTAYKEVNFYKANKRLIN